MDLSFKEKFDALLDEEGFQVTITPETATELLLINAKDARQPHAATIEKYAQAMLDGEWEVREDDPLILAPITRAPIDGRMRLLAQVHAWKSIRYYIKKAKRSPAP